MSQPLITAEALRAAKRRQLAKSGTSTSITSKVAAGASNVKLEADSPAEGGILPPTIFPPKPEPKEVKLEEPPAAAASSVAAAKASKKRSCLKRPP